MRARRGKGPFRPDRHRDHGARRARRPRGDGTAQGREVRRAPPGDAAERGRLQPRLGDRLAQRGDDRRRHRSDGGRVRPLARPPALRRRPRLASQAPVRGSLPWIVGTAAAAIVAAALTGAFVAGRYEGELGQMARELAATRQRLQREVALYRSAADLLRDPTTGGQLVVANLPPATPGKAYELWTIGEGAPRPAGVFRVDALGRATHRVEPVEGGVRVFAVTLEPERGVPAPTGPTVLASAK